MLRSSVSLLGAVILCSCAAPDDRRPRAPDRAHGGETAIPATTEEKLAILKRGARHGERIRELAAVARPATEVRDYASKQNDLSLRDVPEGFAITFANRVTWTVNVDAAGVVRGLGSSGFHDLMRALGIDFPGERYVEGNGS